MMQLLEPLKAESLKDVFITRFEDLILTGKIAIGERLPSERELALQLGVSRPVVHDGLVDLAAKGLVTMRPRVGTVVNDYRREGSLAILTSLINYQEGGLDPALLDSLLDVRELVEIETARLASVNRTKEHLRALRDILRKEKASQAGDVRNITGLDFSFHHTIGMASGNLIYPLLINSFKPVYMNFTSLFFSDPGVVPSTLSFHARLVEAISGKDSLRAVEIMTETLRHGEQHLRALLKQPERSQP
ncbi:MAG: FadR/GntR family transcriptional regulator [Syntrophaceae bacterium]